jgi:deazaflavin-dependent oxidoreductase (nitroreductase family)
LIEGRMIQVERKLKRAAQRFGKVTVNKLAAAVVRSGLSLPVVNPSSVVVVETVGRRSGKIRFTPMGYARISEKMIWVVSEHGTSSDWFRNARAAGEAKVWIGRQCFPATPRVLEDEDPAAVLAMMGSRLVALANRALWYEPKVVEFRFGEH